MNRILSRERAWEVVCKYIEGDTLRRHILTVEGVMRHFAELYGENPDEWGMLGLMHDIDFEKYPDAHCTKAPEILVQEGFSARFAQAVVSQGYGICSEVAPETNAEKVLFTIDELTGLIYAAALMRPSKSIMDLETKSVMKKFKSAGFAANVDREIIRKGAEELDKPLDWIISETISGMRKIAVEIGLDGSAAKAE